MSDYCYCDHCTGRAEPPEPCEYCWITTGQMQVCDGSCDSLTQNQYRNYYNPNWRGRQLIHKGRKP